MKKIVDIPDNFIDVLKKEAIDKGFPSFKAYIDDLIEKEAIRIHTEQKDDLLY